MSLGRIEFTAAEIGDEERRLVSEVLDSAFLSNGSMLAQFEAEFAERVGSPYAVGLSSGTAALHVAAIAAGVEDADLVITPTFSFVASANIILYERAIPLFVDCDPQTMNLDVGQTVDAIERFAAGRSLGAMLPRRGAGPARTLRAVIPVHVFGRPVDLAPIQAAAERHGIAVIEDACEALGSSVDGVQCGTRGQSGVFGFFPNKQITTGEGGMLVTADPRCAHLARSLRNQGRDDDGGWLRYTRVGFNYRLDEMSAAVGLAQLRKLDAMLERRAAIAKRYTELLEPLDGVGVPPPVTSGAEMAWFVYVVRFDEDVDRDRMMSRLAARGIGSRPYFWPIHLQDFYRTTFGFREGDFPNAEAAGRSMLALPFHSVMPLSHVERVCEAIAEELPECRGTLRTPQLARA